MVRRAKGKNAASWQEESFLQRRAPGSANNTLSMGCAKNTQAKKALCECASAHESAYEFV